MYYYNVFVSAQSFILNMKSLYLISVWETPLLTELATKEEGLSLMSFQGLLQSATHIFFVISIT